MDNHPLVKLAYMLYQVSPTIVYGKCWLMEPPRKFCPLYSMRERRLGDTIQDFTHGIIGQALVRWAFVVAFPRAFFLVGKGLAWGGGS